jgi:mRNA-degrading endonuclease RelE of RelBE toxin-antitoxin system
MTTNIKVNKSSQIKLFERPQSPRSGGEKVPMNYPHLHQLQAGDWRISYAVEHNRLAILVLEVLTPEDIAREKITQKIKMKLMEFKDQTAGKKVTAEEVGNKLRVKLLDLSEDLAKRDATITDPGKKQRVKVQILPMTESSQKPLQTTTAGKRKITLLDLPQASEQEEITDGEIVGQEVDEERKVTPLNSPSA